MIKPFFFLTTIAIKVEASGYKGNYKIKSNSNPASSCCSGFSGVHTYFSHVDTGAQGAQSQAFLQNDSLVADLHQGPWLLF